MSQPQVVVVVMGVPAPGACPPHGRMYPQLAVADLKAGERAITREQIAYLKTLPPQAAELWQQRN